MGTVANKPEHSSEDDRITTAVAAELVQQLYSQGASLVYGFPAASAALVVFFWRFVPAAQLLLWLTVIILLSCLRWFLTRAYQRAADARSRFRKWRIRYGRLELASGFAAGMSGMFLEYVPVHFQITLVLLVIGETAGGAVMLAPARRVYLSFLLPATGVLVFWLLRIETLYFVAILILIYTTLMVVMSHNLNRLLVRGVTLGQRNARLLEELRRKNRDLLRSREAADVANQAKSEFLANMSHELRTPMHAILSFAAMGERGVGSVPQEKLLRYFHRIRESGDRLLLLLNDLLDLSKLEVGRMKLDCHRQDLLQVVETAVAELEMLVQQKSLVVEIAPGSGDASALFDADRMLQVVRNLLSNAVKFTPDGKAIRITVAEASLRAGQRREDTETITAVSLTVADEGMGIPEGELEAVFDKFVQSSKTRTGAGGTGLGLAICKEIVEAHKGTIFAVNNADGGATFVVTIPR